MNEIRMTYLSRLTYHKVWLAPKDRPRSHQNLTILDWDDTLLPTSFFLKQDDKNDDLTDIAKANKTTLIQIQRQVLTLLENLIAIGKVVIVTNAKEGWVEFSSFHMLPRVHQLIETYIPVISA